MKHLEMLRCRHRVQVLQAHEDTTKDNAVRLSFASSFSEMILHVFFLRLNVCGVFSVAVGHSRRVTVTGEPV